MEPPGVTAVEPLSALNVPTPEIATLDARDTTQLRTLGPTSGVARNVMKLGAVEVFPDARPLGRELKPLAVDVAPPHVEKYRSD